MSTNQMIVRPRTNALSVDVVTAPSSATHKPVAQILPLTEELVNQTLAGSGLRGWFRAFQVVRVLGLLSLYLFLDGYDVRANFNRKVFNRSEEKARSASRWEHLRLKARGVFYQLLDRLIRGLRYFIFRGSEGSEAKVARLVKQAVWLRESLIKLGPTFIKIGQALGTRADLLPLAYVKELATLQDQVPAFSTSDAFARIEEELGKPLHEC